MSTLIVTGGAGFIGSSFVRLAAQRGARVVVADALTYAGSLRNLEGCLEDGSVAFERVDIADRAAVRGLFERHRPDAVVNFAAETHVDRSIDDPGVFVRTNVAGTFELLEAARRHLASRAADAGRFRFVQISTDEVFGSLGDHGTFDENSPCRPNSPYAASKAAGDHLARAWHATWGLPVLVTHCSNNLGPRQYPEKLVPLMILNALEGRDLPIYGDGGNIRDWLYVEDHCEAVWKVLERGTPGESYAIGAGNAQRNVDLVGAICDALERERPAAANAALQRRGAASYRALQTFVADRRGHDRRYALDASKIRTALGWSPRHDPAGALTATVRWYLENLEWCAAISAGRDARARQGLAGAAEAS